MRQWRQRACLWTAGNQLLTKPVTISSRRVMVLSAPIIFVPKLAKFLMEINQVGHHRKRLRCFKSLGIAIEDLAAAEYFTERQRK